ncbi:glutamate-5-semialdehyde dehydrogenase [Saliterribacillus persicus]|uniref:Gamma-glutamyl phosphate reductase n=1 Tax=Saliterribacillus persicus TaxID=930114 RepID=A0A368X953_9BACI|nr:glutamate-5-semialdehyde dehydrogenase [Saliterribacillus persicus]RCW63756.1 glutamate-5-semialdehyde dehydrogenase [Saliterribacillus persicus]
MNKLQDLGKLVKEASYELAKKTTQEKNDALQFIANALRENSAFIMEENQKDIINGKEKGFHESLLDRLLLSKERIYDIADALEQLINLNDPIGDEMEAWDRPNGLEIKKVRVPIGVVGMIYEARPNVTVDAASLCLKTGNAVLLRGSSSAIHSNKALVSIIHQGLEKSKLPKNAVQLIEDTSRDTANEMFQLNEYLDVLIPRGGHKLIQTVVEKASIPVLETGAGNCHLFIDETAEEDMAVKVAINAKTQRPSVCNAIETVLVHESWDERYFKHLLEALESNNVEVRADESIRNSYPQLKEASEEDWETEFLDKIIAIKKVSSVEEAISHINRYGTKHSESILTNNEMNRVKFMNEVDAAAVYHNASTRFTDGFEFGFGAEIGISTQKLHARGPMGLEALTSTKYLLFGEGQIK